MKLNILKPVLFFLFLTIIPVSFSFGQAVVSKQVADSLLRSLATEKADTYKVRDLLTLAYYEMAHVDYTAAKDKRLYKTLGFIRLAEVLSEKLHATGYLHIAYRYYPRCDFLSGAFEESRRKTIKVDSAEGNFASALTHFKKYKKISDSLYNVTKSGQIAQLEVQYETKQKEQSIKLLNSEARSQKARLDKVNLQRNIILAALVWFAIIGVITYRFYRYKQKSNEAILKSHKLVESKNKQLELLVEEKKWLLKEVHHRVKNNLHTIICLLESQSAFLENDALEAMENSQNRIYTMSLIHQKLYQSDDIQTIDMSIYIPELLQYLKDGFDTSSYQIYFHISIAQISLTQTIAIPIALIINEAVTNSIKYAFPDNTGGEIMISLQEENGAIRLELADNGLGMTKSIQEDTEPRSLGLQLIKGLSKEIQGDLKIESKGGVRITITFEKYPWDKLAEL